MLRAIIVKETNEVVSRGLTQDQVDYMYIVKKVSFDDTKVIFDANIKTRIDKETGKQYLLKP